MVVTVTLIYVLLEHRENSHHTDGLLPCTINAVFVSVQHTQSVVGCLQTVKTGLNEIFMNLNLKGEETGEDIYSTIPHYTDMYLFAKISVPG